ncbi:MAG TPA: hypothetical protein VLD67_14435 [Vicinamibacterales bacterium]|nr:hypothetical protein [Vicinamibacterales bacterium]
MIRGFSTRPRTSYFIASVAAVAWFFPVQAQAPVPAAPAAATTPSDAEIERFLLAAKPIKSRAAPKGVTNSIRATFSDGTLTHDAQIQTVEESRQMAPKPGGMELNFRDSWSFNIAAYRLDRLIGLNLVPVSVEGRWQSKRAAITWWVDDVMMDEGERLKKKAQPPRPAEWAEIMNLVRIFDQLIYNMDRNQGNLLITQDWRIWAIDHTRAFRLHRDLKDPENVARCDRQMFEKLKQLDSETLKREMEDYLNQWEREAILARRDLIVEIIEKRGPGALFDRRDAHN